MRTGLGVALAQQVVQQRIAHGLRTHFHARGVDHVIDVELVGAAIVGVRADAQARAFCHHRVQAAAMQAQLAAFDERLQPGVDLGRDAVAVHVPMAYPVAQEAPLLGQRQRLPQRLHVGADALHHRLPRQAFGHGLFRRGTQEAHAGAQVHRLQRGGVEGGGRAMAMRQRQQRVPRQHMDRARMAVFGEAEHRIDHAQARADDA